MQPQKAVFRPRGPNVLDFIPKGPKKKTLRGQTVHWISVQFNVFVPEIQRQVFKHVEIMLERSKTIEKNRSESSFLVAESAYNSQNTQFGLVMNRDQTVGTKKMGFRFWGHTIPVSDPWERKRNVGLRLWGLTKSGLSLHWWKTIVQTLRFKNIRRVKLKLKEIIPN